jgi:hypothetical protein
VEITRRINMMRKRRSLNEGDDDDGIGEEDEEGSYDDELFHFAGSLKERMNLYFSKFEVFVAVPMKNYYLLGCATV